MAEIVAVSHFSIILVLIPESKASIFLQLRFLSEKYFFVLREQKAFHSLFYVPTVATNVTNIF